MLEQLFGSKTRVRILRLFLNNPSQPYYLRELARKLKSQLNSVRREINNLEKMGIIKGVKPAGDKADKEAEKSPKAKNKKLISGSKKYFVANIDFILYPELKALLLKAQLLSEKSFVRKIESLAPVKLLILTGIFVGSPNGSTDMLLVGAVNRKKLAKITKEFEKNLNRGVNYTIMSQQEFRYRRDITDRFLYDILEGKKMVIVDKITKP